MAVDGDEASPCTFREAANFAKDVLNLPDFVCARTTPPMFDVQDHDAAQGTP